MGGHSNTQLRNITEDALQSLHYLRSVVMSKIEQVGVDTLMVGEKRVVVKDISSNRVIE